MKPGTVIMGRYRVESLIGLGGMGAVYLARGEQDERVAVKCVRRDRNLSGRRFKREVQLLAELEHPAIVRCLGVDIGDGDEYVLVMEWLDGADLSQRLRRGPLSVAETLLVGHRIADALHHAHQRGIVHRDVKPGNIFLPDERIDGAKLLDFGAARWSAATTLTASETLIGTPTYMAPEQVRCQRDIGPPADVFALGCVLYECLTGWPAFAGEQIHAIFYKILVEAPPRVSELIPGVAPAVDELIARMLEKSIEARPESGPELLASFERLLAAQEIAVPGEAATSARDTLTQAERRMISAVMVASRMSLEEWLVSVVQDRAGNANDMAYGPTDPWLGETLPEGRGLEAIRGRFKALGARFEQLGDGSLLAVFDAWGAAKDRAHHAARCALELRAMYPGRQIAVATGRAILARERILGEVIEEVAALVGREPSEGTGGAILVDATTAALIDGRFSTRRDEDALVLLGESGEFEESDASRFMGRDSPFVGRSKELAMLTAALAQCVDEEEAQVTIVTGPAGMGKSRLRREFARQVLSQYPDAVIWRARGDVMRARSSLAAIAQIIRTLAGIREDEPAATRRAKLRSRVAQRLGAEDVERVAAFLGEIVDTRWSDDEHMQLATARRDAQLMSAQRRRAFEDLVDAETSARTVIIELDDIHWCDHASLVMIDHVLRRLRHRPLLVLGYGRDEVREVFPDLWARRGTIEIRIGPLSARAAEKLVRDMVEDTLTHDQLRRLLDYGQGNPLFLEELMRCAAEGLEVSDTVLALIDVRLLALSPRLRRVLRAASIFGVRSWRTGLDALLGREDGLDEALQALMQQELLVRHSASKFAGQREFSFRHALMREAVYHMLTEEDRRLGHRLAGEWLRESGEADPLVLAEHFELGGQPERATAFLLRAAQNALDANELNAALELAERGIAHGADGELLGEIRAVQACAYVWLGDYERTTEAGEEALSRLAPGSRGWYDVAEHLVHARVNLGRVVPLEDMARNMAMGPAPGHDVEGWTVLSSAIAGGLMVYGHMEAGLALTRAIEEMIERYPTMSPRALGHVSQSALAVRYSLVEMNICASIRQGERALEYFEKAGNLRAALVGRMNIAWCKETLGAYEEAYATFSVALDQARQLGIPRLVDDVNATLGWVSIRLGQVQQGLLMLERGVRAFEERSDQRMASFYRGHLTRGYLCSGELERADEESLHAIGLGRDIPGATAYTLACRAQVLLERSRPDQALECASKAMSLLEELGGVEEGEALIRLVFAETQRAGGRDDRARAAIREARDRLVARAQMIDEPRWRRSFLENVTENARIMALAEDIPSLPA